jgi:ParB family chromosome partitioning protein
VDEPDNLIPLCLSCHKAIHDGGYSFVRWRGGYRYEHSGRQEAESHTLDCLYSPEGEVVWNLEYADFPVEEGLGVAIQQARNGIDVLASYLPFLTATLCQHVFQECQELNTRNLWRLRARLEARALEVAFGWREDGKPYGKEEKKEAVAKAFGVSVSTIERDERALPWVLAGSDTPRSSIFEEIEREQQSSTMPDERTRLAHVAHATGENEWFTPPEYIKAAATVMGGIDLDPASCEAANRTVQADRFYTKEDDGLIQAWAGRVWMNPPYSQPLIGKFTDKLVENVEAGNVEQACVLVNNATETGWFQPMLEACSAICLMRGRVKFLDAEGQDTGAPLQGQAVLYFGNNVPRFREVFSEFGVILRRAE